MPKRTFQVDVDFTKKQLLNPVIHNLGVAPSAPVQGQLYFDTSATPDANDGILFVYNGVSWDPLNVDTGDPDQTLSWTQASHKLTLSGDGDTIISLAGTGATDYGVASFSGSNFAISSGVVSIKDGGVLYAEIQNVAANNVLLGNDNGAGQSVQELSASEVRAILSVAENANNYAWNIDSDSNSAGAVANGSTVSIDGGYGLITSRVGTTITTDLKLAVNDNFIHNLTASTGLIDTDEIAVDDAVDGVRKTTLLALKSYINAAAGSFSSFDIGADSGTSPQTVIDGEVVNFLGGTGVVTTMAGVTSPYSITFDLDYLGVDNFLNSAPTLANPTTADYILYHDVTDNNIKKALISDLPDTHPPVSLTGTPNYLSFVAGTQVLTQNAINLATAANVTGVLPIGNFASIDEDNMASNSDTQVPTQQSVVAYVASQIVGGMKYKGGFNANTGTPDLNSITSDTGDTYTVTVAGTYNWTTGSAVLEVGDMLVAEEDGILNNVADWTIVNKNIDDLGTPGTNGAVTRRFEVDCDADTSTTVNHGFNLPSPFLAHVQVFDKATGHQIEAEHICSDANNVIVNFSTAPALAEYTILVIG
jgi:hypothetical protein